MSPRLLLVLAALVVLLLGAYLLVTPSRPEHGSGEDLLFRRGMRLFPAFDPQQARIVELRKGEVQVRLEKVSAERWVIANRENRKADLSRIKGLLEDLREITVVEPRPGALERFELDEARRSTLRVLGEEGKVLVEAGVGKAPAYGTSFLKLPQGEEAVEVNRDLDARLGTRTRKERRVLPLEHWYDLTVARFDRETVRQISIERGGEQIRLERFQLPPAPLPAPQAEPKAPAGEKPPPAAPPAPQWAWRITHPRPLAADENACSGIAAVASILFAKGYADEIPPPERGFAKPSAVVRLSLADGTRLDLLFGSVAEEHALLKVEGRPEEWLVERYVYEGLVKSLEKLRKEEPAQEAQEASGGRAQPSDAEGASAGKAPQREKLPGTPAMPRQAGPETEQKSGADRNPGSAKAPTEEIPAIPEKVRPGETRRPEPVLPAP